MNALSPASVAGDPPPCGEASLALPASEAGAPGAFDALLAIFAGGAGENGPLPVEGTGEFAPAASCRRLPVSAPSETEGKPAVAGLPPEILGLAVCAPVMTLPEAPSPPAAGGGTGRGKGAVAFVAGGPRADFPTSPSPGQASKPVSDHGTEKGERPVPSFSGSIEAERSPAFVPAHPVSAAKEKVAGLSGRMPDAGLETMPAGGKIKTLSPVAEHDENRAEGDGIQNAKSLPAMRTAPESLPLSASVTSVPGAERHASFAAGERISPAGFGAGDLSDKGQAAPVPVSDPAGVVREVVELTHEFRARERGSVEVRFQLGDRTELSVRLAYRDGAVHTTFRTDSDELRAALSRDWQAYAAGAASGSDDRRMADPVFVPASDAAHGAPARDAGAAGDREGRRQSFAQADQPSDGRGGVSPRLFRSSAPGTAGPAIRPAFLSDHHLHAFA